MIEQQAKVRAGRKRDVHAHEAILDAAAAILQHDGYSKFTIEQIARVSGTGKPTIYRWWPNKTALLIELFDRSTTDPLRVADLGSGRQELLAWFDNLWSVWQRKTYGEAFRSIIAEIQSDRQALEFFSTNFLPHRRQLLLDILERAESRGELRPGLNLNTVVDYMWGHNWYHLLTRTTPKPEAFEQLIDTVCLPR